MGFGVSEGPGVREESRMLNEGQRIAGNAAGIIVGMPVVEEGFRIVNLVLVQGVDLVEGLLGALGPEEVVDGGQIGRAHV